MPKICCREDNMFKNCARKTVFLLVEEEKMLISHPALKINSNLTEKT